MDSPIKKGGKLARAVHSLPLIHFNKDVDAIRKSKTVHSSPKSLSSSDNTPKSFKFMTVEKSYENRTLTFAYDGLNTTPYSIFSFKMLDDGMIYCKGLLKQSIFAFSYELVSKQYEGKAVLYENGCHTILDGDWDYELTVLRVYSRCWTGKGKDTLNKKYPVYVTSRKLSVDTAKFVDDHCFCILRWFA